MRAVVIINPISGPSRRRPVDTCRALAVEVFTRHGAEVRVPEVRQLSAEDAEDELESAGLRAEQREQPFNPNLPADIVVDQTPLPGSAVKPGRRIYYYVNARPREMVRVPA